MALTQDANGQNTYTPDALNSILPSGLATQPAYLAPSVRPLAPPRVFITRQIDANTIIVRQVIYEGRGNPKQAGDANDHASWASSDLVPDDVGILRLAFLTGSQATPDPNSPVRQVSANALGVAVTSCYDPAHEDLYRETNATDPTIISQVGYTPPAGVTGITCLETAMANAVPALLIGYAATGGNPTLQAVTNLTAWAATNVAAIVTAVYGVTPTFIDGDSILLNYGSVLATAPTATTAWGALAFTTKATGIPPFSYMAGVSKLGGSDARVHMLLPLDGSVAGSTGAKSRHVSFDLRGTTFSARDHTRDWRLPWLRYMNLVGDNLFGCDGTSHYFNTGRSVIPVDKSADYAPNSDYKRQCLGHYPAGDKVFWLVNEVSVGSASRHTYRVVMEYDIYLNTIRQVSRSIDVGNSGVQSIGGPKLLWSEQNYHIHDYTGGKWYNQYQPPASLQGFAQRKTGHYVSTGGAPSVWTADTAGGGQEFEAQGTRVHTALDLLGGEWTGATYVPLRAGFGGDVNAGGPGGTPAHVDITANGQLVKFTADTKTPLYGIPFKTFQPFGSGAHDRADVVITGYQQVGGTDPTRYTPNCYPVVIDWLVKRHPVMLPSREQIAAIAAGHG